MLELFRVLGVGTVPALLGLFRVPHIDFRLVSDPVGASVSNGSWTIRGRKAGCYRGEFKLCPILLLFSSLVFRASPRTAFKCSMQAKARGLLPRIRVVALQGLPFHEGILNSVGMLFSASWNWAATASTGPQLPRPFPYARKSRAGGRLQCPQLRNVCLKFPQLVQSIVRYDI